MSKKSGKRGSWIEEWDEKHPEVMESIRREELDATYCEYYEEIWGYYYGRNWRDQKAPGVSGRSYTDRMYWWRKDTRPLVEKVKDWEKNDPPSEVDEMLFNMWKKARKEENNRRRWERIQAEEDEKYLKWWENTEKAEQKKTESPRRLDSQALRELWKAEDEQDEKDGKTLRDYERQLEMYKDGDEVRQLLEQVIQAKKGVFNAREAYIKELEAEEKYWENYEEIWSLGPFASDVLEGEVLEPNNHFKEEADPGQPEDPEPEQFPHNAANVKWFNTLRHRIYVVLAVFLFLVCLVLGLMVTGAIPLP